jgi:hypothetical protein
MSPRAGLKNLRWVLLLPRLRRGLNDCARFAGFRATTDFRLTLMRRKPWDEEELNYVPSPSGATDLCRPLRRAESLRLAPMGCKPTVGDPLKGRPTPQGVVQPGSALSGPGVA